MPQKIEISSKTIIFTVLFLLSLRVIWQVREVIYALFLAFIFMSALKPAVNRLERYKIARPVAAFLVFLVSVASIIFAIFFIVPPIVTESIVFLKSLPLFIVESFPFLSGQISTDSVIRFLPDISKNFVRVAGGLFSNFLFVISVLFFTFYFLLEEKFLKGFLERFFDRSRAGQLLSIAQLAERRMGAWMWSMVVLMSIIGVSTYIGLSLLNIRFALSLAFVAGLLEVVPIIGPTISLVPAFFVAASDSLFSGGAVILLYLIIQQLESNVIVPVVMKKTVGLNPITTLIALSVGTKLGGLMGAVLAVPAALLFETIISEFIKTKD